MLSSLLLSTVSAHTSHTTLTCTPLLLHTYSPCTHTPHAHPTHMLSLLYSPSHRPFTCTASAHPSQTAAHTLRLRHTLWPHSLTHPGQPGFRCSCTQRTPRVPCSLAPIQTCSELRCLTFLHVCIISVHAYLCTPSRPRSTRGYECLHSAPSGTCVHTHICSLSFLCAYMCVLLSALHHALSRSHQTIIQRHRRWPLRRCYWARGLINQQPLPGVPEWPVMIMIVVREEGAKLRLLCGLGQGWWVSLSHLGMLSSRHNQSSSCSFPDPGLLKFVEIWWMASIRSPRPLHQWQ